MTPSSFTVSWTDPTGAPPLVKQTQVRVASPQGAWIDNPAGTTAATTQLHAGISPATTYDVRVHVSNAVGENWSAIVQATTPAGSPNGVVLDVRVQNPRQTFIDSFGVTWGISPHGVILQNNATDTQFSQGVLYMALVNDTLYQMSYPHVWYQRATAAAPNNLGWTQGTSPLPFDGERVWRTNDLIALWGVNIGAYDPAAPSSALHVAAMRYLGFSWFRAPCTPDGVTTNAIVEALCADGRRGSFIVFPPGYAAADTATAQAFAATAIGQQITRVGVSKVGAFEVCETPMNNALTAQQVQTLSAGLNAARGARSDTNVIVPVISFSSSFVGDMTATINYDTAVGDTGTNWSSWSSFTNLNNCATQPWTSIAGPQDGKVNAGVVAPYRPWIAAVCGVDVPGAAVGYEQCTSRAGAMMVLNVMLDQLYLDGGPPFLASLYDDYGNQRGLFATSALAGTTTVVVSGTTVFPYRAATALHNLTTILADASSVAATFAPGGLNYSFPSLPPDARSLLTQKGNGVFELLVWNEPGVQSTVSPPVDVFPTAENTTISFVQAIAALSVYDPMLGTTRTSGPVSVAANGTFNFLISGSPIVLEITPA